MSRRLVGYYTVAVIVVIIWFFAAYRPLHSRLQEADVRHTSLRHQLDEYHATARELPNLLERQKELLQSKAVLESKLYAKANILSLIDDVKKAARSTGLSVYDITPSMEQLLQMNQHARSSTEPLFLNVSVTVDGRFTDFGAYVAKLEQEAFFRGITRCSVYSGKNPGDKVRCTIAFKAILGSSAEGIV